MSRKVRLAPDLEVSAQSVEEARFIYREVFQDNCYLRGVELGPRPTVVDVGANIGLFALRVLRQYPEAQLVCFEPAPESFRLLQQNLRSYSARLLPIAVADREGRELFYYYPWLPGNSTLNPRMLDPITLDKLYFALLATESAWWKRLPFQLPGLGRWLFRVLAYLIWGRPQVVETPVTRLSTWLEPDLEIDLLKIDVERAEMRVLDGLEEDDFARIGRLAIEVTSLDLERGHLERLTSRLEGLGYQISVTESDPSRRARQAIEQNLGLEGRVDHLVLAWRVGS